MILDTRDGSRGVVLRTDLHDGAVLQEDLELMAHVVETLGNPHAPACQQLMMMIRVGEICVSDV